MSQLETYKRILDNVQTVGIVGRVSGVRGLTVSVADFPVPLGASCKIVRGQNRIEARVIGFAGEETLIMPVGKIAGICRGDRVVFTSTQQAVGVGEQMLGRVLNGLGEPIDGLGNFQIDRNMPLCPDPIDPMMRERISQPLATGVRSIDAMLTVGRGQRIGIFSGSGVGKSILLGMVGRYTSAEVRVIALIGERGREVRDFLEKDLGSEGLANSVVVVSTGDQPPLMRVQAAFVATAIAEYFRDLGRDVLLLVDSLTRLANAQRQVGLAAGEPPATKGYTPSVFNLLPELLERSGRTETGSITGFYTVLVEGDDPSEPVSDAVRAATDGHILLSRHLANRGHYPAVDVLQSISRVMIDVADADHKSMAKDIQRLIALYSEIEEMVNIGAYQAGSNSEYDIAIAAMEPIHKFLVQEITESSDFEQTKAALSDLREQILKISKQIRKGTSASAG